MFYVYVITIKIRNYIYVGISNNFQRRIKEHQQRKSSTTRAYRPFDLLLIETFETRGNAREREKYLKSGRGKEWIKSNFIHR